ncbi:MAG: T9SS type A sorting domain-containing protein, partial [Bacteroidia bacterium]|nr:T9SS type A sorting domain-containing protein [Bacteroidia bacterium]
LRNNADVQYVQNGIITQTNPLNYIARQTIEAGHAVDPNTDQPQGNFDVLPGADVTFEAGDIIHLTNGFQVSGGSFSAFTNTNIPGLPVCYDAQRIMPQQPKDNKQKSLAAMQQFAISPNPSSTGVFNIRFRNLPFNGELSVFNALGIEVKRIENIQQTSLTVSVEGLAKGIYMFRYRDGTEMYQTKSAVFY